MQAARGASLRSDDSTDAVDATPEPSTVPPPRPRRRRFLVLFAVVAVLGYGADLLTKELALAHLEPHTAVPVVGSWFGLFLTFNSGAAFSLGTSYTVVLSCIAVAATLGVLWTVRRVGSVGWALALGFLLAGIVGNLTDRIFRDPSPMRGHVVDFLALPNFPVFNLADICINVAAGCVILQAVRGVRVDGTREVTPPRDPKGGRRRRTRRAGDQGGAQR